jgi:hypothetical protein
VLFLNTLSPGKKKIGCLNLNLFRPLDAAFPLGGAPPRLRGGDFDRSLFTGLLSRPGPAGTLLVGGLPLSSSKARGEDTFFVFFFFLFLEGE